MPENVRPYELAERLQRLVDSDKPPRSDWQIEKETHSYKDGTTHFTHVVKYNAGFEGEKVKVRIGEYVTPELAELLCSLHNNIDLIIRALRKAECNT